MRPSELCQDIFPDFLRGRRGERADLPDCEFFGGLSEVQIRWPEIMAPLAYAVGLIHDEHVGRVVTEKAPERVRLESFRRDVKKVNVACRGIAHDLELFVRGNGRVDACRRDASFRQRGHLILHKRDERRDHDGKRMAHQGGKLVAQTLPGSSRHDDTEIVPGQDVVDDAFLVVQEGVIAEKMLEGFPGIGAHGLLRGIADAFRAFCNGQSAGTSSPAR